MFIFPRSLCGWTSRKPSYVFKSMTQLTHSLTDALSQIKLQLTLSQSSFSSLMQLLHWAYSCMYPLDVKWNRISAWKKTFDKSIERLENSVLNSICQSGTKVGVKFWLSWQHRFVLWPVSFIYGDTKSSCFFLSHNKALLKLRDWYFVGSRQTTEHYIGRQQ